MLLNMVNHFLYLFLEKEEGNFGKYNPIEG